MQQIHLQEGDHIRVHRGAYWHHAIVSSRQPLRVVHYSDHPDRWGKGLVQEQSFRRFLLVADQVELVNLPSRFSPAQVVARARSKLGRDRYNFARENCEHFASWCQTGRWFSAQVHDVGTAVSQTGEVVFGGALVAFAVAVVLKVVGDLLQMAAHGGDATESDDEA